MRKDVQMLRSLMAVALVSGVAMPAWAVDGVMLIDQNKAVTRDARFLDAIIPGQAGGYIGNSLSGNALSDVVTLGGWVNAGQNVCGTALCP